MRYLGIDYGTKNIGLAISDEGGAFAFPLQTIKNSPNLVGEIEKIILTEEIGAVVIGESKNFQGWDNPVMAAVRIFADQLEGKTGLKIIFESEYLTSREAERVPGGEEEDIDARAAALILRSYLEKKNKL